MWVVLGAEGAPRSCPAGFLAEVGLRWWRREAVMNRMEDLNVEVREVKICQKAIGYVLQCDHCFGRKARGIDPCQGEGTGGRSRLEAIAGDRVAAIPFRSDHRGHDEGHRLAATLGAWLPGRRGAQAHQAQARLEEGGRRAHLPDRGPWRGWIWRSPVKAPSVLNGMARLKIAPAIPDREAIDVEIARLRDIDVIALRARWHSAFGRRAPPHLPRHLLSRVLAYRLQADHLGDLDADSQRLLDRSGSPEQAGQRAVDPGRQRQARDRAGPRMERTVATGGGACRWLCLERQNIS